MAGGHRPASARGRPQLGPRTPPIRISNRQRARRTMTNPVAPAARAAAAQLAGEYGPGLPADVEASCAAAQAVSLRPIHRRGLGGPSSPSPPWPGPCTPTCAANQRARRKARAPPATATATWPGSSARQPSARPAPTPSWRAVPADRPPPRLPESHRGRGPLDPGHRLAPAVNPAGFRGDFLSWKDRPYAEEVPQGTPRAGGAARS
jgi:hypothetical protein